MLSVLKMSFILLFLTLFQAVATNSYSQSVTISVKTDQAPLTDLFAIIEKQSDFLFFYVDSDVKNVKVSVNATDKVHRKYLIASTTQHEFEIFDRRTKYQCI